MMNKNNPVINLKRKREGETYGLRKVGK